MSSLTALVEGNTCLKFMQAAQWYEWNINRRTIVTTAYGVDHDDGYINEKVSKLAKYGLLGLFAEMDTPARQRLVNDILDRYGWDAELVSGRRRCNNRIS
tara:strand:+ start:236 stop:535 length:300 start_codon:yes stop_codon:yes gene_type:complete